MYWKVVSWMSFVVILTAMTTTGKYLWVKQLTFSTFLRLQVPTVGNRSSYRFIAMSTFCQSCGTIGWCIAYCT